MIGSPIVQLIPDIVVYAFVSGFILNPHDVDGLVQAVLAVTKDEQTAQAMGEYGREECRRALSGETMVGNLLAIYRELLSGGKIA